MGVGKGAEPSTVWAWLGCYSVSWKHSWGPWVWGKRKINIHHECAILFHSFLRERFSNQHCGLRHSLHAAHPSLSLRINAAPSGDCVIQPSQILLNAAEQCSSEQSVWAEHCASGVAQSNSRVQTGAFFYSCFLFSPAQRRRMPGCSKGCHFPLFLRRPHGAGEGAVHHLFFLSQEAMRNRAKVISTFVRVNHPLLCILMLIVVYFTRLLSQPKRLHLSLLNQGEAGRRGVAYSNFNSPLVLNHHTNSFLRFCPLISWMYQY